MQVIQRKPYDNFVQACKSPETRREYTAGLKRFLVHYKIGDWERLEKLQLKESQTVLFIYYIFKNKFRHIVSTSGNN
jgi:hypothetical protein